MKQPASYLKDATDSIAATQPGNGRCSNAGAVLLILLWCISPVSGQAQTGTVDAAANPTAGSKEMSEDSKAQPRMVEAAAKPGQEWKKYPTRTLEDFPSIASATADTGLSKYGGLLARKEKATGFFHTAKVDGRWWLVDPEGCLFLNKGVNSVNTIPTPGAQAALEKQFGTPENWAKETTKMIRDLGFNTVGAWSDPALPLLRAVAEPLAYTRIWDFMSAYGKRRGGTYQQSGHVGYPKDCIFVFDPEFEKFCDEYAKQLAAQKDDPWLLGHFSDNEMPLRRHVLANYLALPDDDAGHQAALKWLRERHGADATVKDITEQDQADFLGVVAERYFRIVSQAIKKYDPNHLYIGCRFNGKVLQCPEVFKAAGKYVDVVSCNYYRVWTPVQDELAGWERDAGKPILITEWYAKGVDSGMPNNSGSGWLVKTQQERGQFYENFTLALIESKVCVGWHWFKYIDNDPDDKTVDPSNTDSNKGLVNARYAPYQPLLDSMKRLNQRAYRIVSFFEGNQTEQKAR